MGRKCLFAFGVALVVLAPLTAADKDEGKLDPAKLVGTWTYVSAVEDGKKKTADDFFAKFVEVAKSA